MLKRVDKFSRRKKRYSYDQCPNPVCFSTPLLIRIHLSGIETLICHKGIEFDRVCFLCFCTKCYKLYDFQNTVLNHTGIVYDKYYKNYEIQWSPINM